MHRTTIIAAGILLIVTAAGLATWFYVGHTGPTPLEQWLARQFVTLLDAYLVPRVDFDLVDYEAPRTVHIHNLTLASDDETLISVQHARLTLAATPRIGSRWQIEQIVLTQPRLSFTRTADNHLRGWQPFLQPATTTNTTAVDAGVKLSDVLVLRQVHIRDGSIQYRDTAITDRPLVLSGLTLQLQTTPTPDDPGMYALSFVVEHSDLLNLRFTGALNLDTATLQADEFAFHAQLAPNQHSALPPALQDFAQTHDLAGNITARAKGTLPLHAPTDTRGTLDADFTDLRLVANDQIWSAGTGTLALAAEAAESFRATGRLTVNRGRLMHVPVIADFITRLRDLPLTVDLPPTDKAIVEFTLHPTYAELHKTEITSALVGLRATGRVNYTSKLDLFVNAGTLEKVQNELGVVGDLFSQLSDKLVRYHVTGTATDPTIKVQPLGLGG